jgi:arginyl-tRNA synthetase
MSTVADALTELVKQAAIAAGHGDSPVAMEPVVPTNDSKHGDYQSNFAFRLGKATKANPRALAEKIVASLPPSPMVAKAEVAGPGFVNLFLADAWLGAEVARRGADARLGTPATGAGKTMVIDYSSPNIAKRMHVGHLRSTIIGAALHKLHAFLGWKVVADNHIGDWGTQFGKLIVAWRSWKDDAAYIEDPIGELQRLYVDFGVRAKEDPALDDAARAETAKLQAGDPANRALWEQFCAVSMQEFDDVYARLGVKFDVVHGESFYRDELAGIVDELMAKGFAEESEGAVIVRLGDVEPSLENTPMLIRKRDGAALYATTDLATARHRLRTWAPDRVVYVTDKRQQHHFDQVFAACKKTAFLGAGSTELVHVGFGLLRLPDGMVLKTREMKADADSATSLNLKSVLDAAAAHARTVVDHKSGELPEAERYQIAEAVGIGAVRYADLSQNPQSDITFDWDKMLSLDGNTAPYLMYAYARCRSIFRKGELDFDAFVPGPATLEHPSERSLAVVIVRLPEAIADAARTYRPSVLAEHLFHTANLFARFYDDCRVLDQPEPVRSSRLALVYATARALAIGLDLLGLRALDRM